LLVLIPVASQTSIRYYNIVFFVPFVLLGLILELLLKKMRKKGMVVVLSMVVITLVSHAVVLAQASKPYMNKSASNVDVAILGEIEPMVEYLIKNKDQENKIYLDGQKMYLKRFFKPFEYLAQKSGVQIIKPGNENEFKSGLKYFYVDGKKSKQYIIGDKIKDGVILETKNFQNIMIYKLKKI
jgi:hypothetical protein